MLEAAAGFHVERRSSPEVCFEADNISMCERSFKNNMRRIFWLIAALAALALTSPAQTTSGSVAGSVVDAQQSAVVNASVSIMDQERRTVFTAKSDAEGRFVFPQLPPGKYTLTVEAPGFKKTERKDLNLLANDKITAGTI